MDHLDFIRIRGLESSDTEVFQGMGGATLTAETSGGTSPGTTTSLEWGEIPTEVLEQVAQYTTDLNEWIAEAVRYDPDSGTRSLVPELLDNLPVVPIVTTAVTAATAPVALPAVATVMLSQVIMNQVGTAVAEYARSHDPDAPENILKKAFLWDNDGTLESILKTAMLRVSDTEKSILRERLTALEQPLKDLSLIDATIEAGNDLKVRVKGKALEF